MAEIGAFWRISCHRGGGERRLLNFVVIFACYPSVRHFQLARSRQPIHPLGLDRRFPGERRPEFAVKKLDKAGVPAGVQ